MQEKCSELDSKAAPLMNSKKESLSRLHFVSLPFEFILNSFEHFQTWSNNSKQITTEQTKTDKSFTLLGANLAAMGTSQ